MFVFFATEPFACVLANSAGAPWPLRGRRRSYEMFQVTAYACQLQPLARVRTRRPSTSTVAKRVDLLAAPATSTNAAQKMQAVLGMPFGWPSLTQWVQAVLVARQRAIQTGKEKPRRHLWCRQKRKRARGARCLSDNALRCVPGGCAVAQPACVGGRRGLVRSKAWCGPRESWQKQKRSCFANLFIYVCDMCFVRASTH